MLFQIFFNIINSHIKLKENQSKFKKYNHSFGCIQKLNIIKDNYLALLYA